MSPSAAHRATARFCGDFGPSANAKVRAPKVRASIPQIDRGSTQRPYPGPEGTGLAPGPSGIAQASCMVGWSAITRYVVGTAGVPPYVSLSPETGVSAPSLSEAAERRALDSAEGAGFSEGTSAQQREELDDRLELGGGQMTERRHRGARIDDGAFEPRRGECRSDVGQVGTRSRVADVAEPMARCAA